MTQRMIAGCDEAGRGCLAGPVVAAAVILPESIPSDIVLADSKTLSAKHRAQTHHWLLEHSHVGIGVVEPSVIDEMNILQAAIRAMHVALDQLEIQADEIFVDGNYFHPYRDIPHRCEVKGDARFSCIAAASIVAKHHRDQIMVKLDQLHPMYGWIRNKGYPTRQHRQAIASHGVTSQHRRSFRLLVEG